MKVKIVLCDDTQLSFDEVESQFFCEKLYHIKYNSNGKDITFMVNPTEIKSVIVTQN